MIISLSDLYILLGVLNGELEKIYYTLASVSLISNNGVGLFSINSCILSPDGTPLTSSVTSVSTWPDTSLKFCTSP